MIYLFSGDDAKNKILSQEKFINSLGGDMETFFVSRNNFDRSRIESFYSGASLFAAKSLVVLQDLFEREETRDFILERLPQMGESANIFVFTEGKLNKPILDAFKKTRAEMNIFELPKEKREKFDNFLLANAFARRDKLGAWTTFREAIGSGSALEELAGILFWKVKDTLLKRDFSRFKEAELESIAARLSYLLPEARKKSGDAELAFEEFLLKVL